MKKNKSIKSHQENLKKNNAQKLSTSFDGRKNKSFNQSFSKHFFNRSFSKPFDMI